MVNVPRMPELSVENLIKDVVKDKKINRFLPDLYDEVSGRMKTINRQYLFNIINTIKPTFFPENIQMLLKQRKDQ